LGHLPGLSETTSGCIRQVYVGAGEADSDACGKRDVCGQALSIAQIIAIIPRKEILVFKCNREKWSDFE